MSKRNLIAVRQTIAAAREQTARAKSAQFPEGHVIAVAFARIFGPWMATTPDGHPVTIGSGRFDLTTETPQHAIARAARHWHGIEIHEPHWVIEMEESLNIAPNHPMQGKVSWSKFFHLRYLPEEQHWKERRLHDLNVPNPFRTAWYLTRNWQRERSGK